MDEESISKQKVGKYHSSQVINTFCPYQELIENSISIKQI